MSTTGVATLEPALAPGPGQGLVLVHGIRDAKDLSIPAECAIAGASAALAVSFIVLALAWRTSPARRRHPGPTGSRLDRATRRRPVVPRHGTSRGLHLLRVRGVVGHRGTRPRHQPRVRRGVRLVVVGVVFASLLVGSFYRAVNPVRTLHLAIARAAGRDPGGGTFTLPEGVGMWPAAVGPLSVFGRPADGRLVTRSPLGNFDGVPVRPGLVAVVAVLLGSTGFDSFKDSRSWLRFVVLVSGSG